MGGNEKIKESVQESLIKNFIDNKVDVEKEMKLLNVLISSFCDNEYTYDEYCKKRMEFELEACDKALNVDAKSELEISDADRIRLQNLAMRKVMTNSKADFKEVLKEEYVQHLTQKCFEIDKKIYYQISKYSSFKLLGYKIPESICKDKRRYFENICEGKAKNNAEANAKANMQRHEEQIRVLMI